MLAMQRFLLAAIFAGITANASADEPRSVRVFLFAGQSNMAAADSLIAGTGEKTLSDAGLQTDADRAALFTYGPMFRGEESDGFTPWQAINGHRGSSFGTGTSAEGKPFYVHGPEVGFARTLHAASVTNIAIIKVSANIPYHPAAGEMWPWSKGKKNASPDYYAQWQEFVRARLDELKARGLRYEVAGFAWHQGIDDGINRETRDTYASRLCGLIRDLRAEYECPDAPFVLARSCKSPIATPEAMEPIRAAQVSIADHVLHGGWIDVDDLPTVNSHHFPDSAQLEIGARMGKEWLRLSGATN